MTSPVYVVLGAGPGLGLSTARRFARAGFSVVLVGQTVEQMEPLAQQLRDEGFPATGKAVNLSDPDDVMRVAVEIGEEHDRVDVLHFNPSLYREKDPLHLSVGELLEDVAVGAAALLPAVQGALEFMAPGARVLVTGSAAADTPYAAAASLGVQKAAVRNLVTSLDATLQPRGVRAVAMQVNGVLAKDGAFAPDAVADALFAAATRAEEDWTPHVPYNG